MRREVCELLVEKGASLVGFADLSTLPDAATRGYRYGVSIGVALKKDVVSGIPSGPHPDYDREYREVNALLDELGLSLEEWLRSKNEDAYAITVARAPYVSESCQTDLPHKTVARLAGHGWIGKCALLITPEYGSAVRFTTVLTNAVVYESAGLHANGCGNCLRCAEACPGSAIKGTAWRENVTRDELVSTDACQAVFKVRSERSGQRNGACGLCIAACPYTRRYLA